MTKKLFWTGCSKSSTPNREAQNAYNTARRPSHKATVFCAQRALILAAQKPALFCRGLEAVRNFHVASRPGSGQPKFSSHKFNIISLCGINGHLALGVMWAAARFLKANCEPAINTFLPN
jgi:hypothetical protein